MDSLKAKKDSSNKKEISPKNNSNNKEMAKNYTSSDFYNEDKFQKYITNKDLEEYLDANINLKNKSKSPIGNKNTFSKYSQLVLELRLNVGCQNSIYLGNVKYNLSSYLKKDIELLLKYKLDQISLNKIKDIKGILKERSFDNFFPDIILRMVNKNNIKNLPADIVYKGNYFQSEIYNNSNLYTNIIVECKTNLLRAISKDDRFQIKSMMQLYLL